MIDEQATAAPQPKADKLEGWIEPAENGATILRLEFPIEIRTGVIVTRLVIARIRAKHLRHGRDDSLDSKLRVIAAASSEGIDVIDDLRVADMIRALAVVERDFSDGPATGGDT